MRELKAVIEESLTLEESDEFIRKRGKEKKVGIC